MNDEKRKPIDEIRDAFHLIHRVATGQSDRGYMSIPPNPARDADLIVDAAIDELEAARVHIDGEPERLARAREEQREVCALEAKEYCCGQEPERVVRLTPLATTPLADENAALRQQRDDAWADLWAAHERLDEFGSEASLVDGIGTMRLALCDLRRENDTLRARAAELEAENDDLNMRLEKVYKYE